MRIKNGKIIANIITFVFLVFFISLTTFTISQFGINFLEKFQNESGKQSAQLLRNDKNNEELKELTIKVSPNQKKQAYFQRKFSEDNITNIDDQDYMSVILNQENGKEVLFHGNFKLSYLEWLNDDEVKIYKGCGSSCLVSYVVNTNTKEINEFVEKTIEQTP